ncbi:transglycosylase SLT domain-containing protein [Undibacterium sp. TJN19]|uniref:transglycosylase SLT domain-containing protein n=1 Tax=Undibacterium sp. TJN19 TaxID=3413055 RepID=UPI003BF0E4E6
MRNFLSALSLPVVCALAVIVLVSCSLASAQAETIPRAAYKYKGDLTRIAKEVWGLDAPVPMLAAQIHQESGWNPDAVSKVGALGMTQFMPATAKWWCDLNKLSARDCQPRNPIWSMRSLAGYDLWIADRTKGETEFDLLWAALRGYNGGLGHWLKEAALVRPALNHEAIDAACGRASRSIVHCKENLDYPNRILNRLQPIYAGWGRTVSPT